MDDFSGSCGEGKSPLISAVRDILKPYGSSGPISEWGLKSDIAGIEVTARQSEGKGGNERSTWRPQLSYKPRPTWKSRISNSVEEKPTFSAKPKPAWKLKPTRKPTSVPKIGIKTTDTKKRPTSRPEPTYRTITKQHSAAGSVDCTKVGLGIFPDPSSCDYFILCLPGGQQTYRRIRMDCPEGTRFDRDSVSVIMPKKLNVRDYFMSLKETGENVSSKYNLEIGEEKNSWHFQAGVSDVNPFQTEFISKFYQFQGNSNLNLICELPTQVNPSIPYVFW